MKNKLLTLLTFSLATQLLFAQPTITPIKTTAKTPHPIEKTKEEKADIFLNFENATLSSVVNYLADLKNINFIPHKGLETVKV